MKTPLIKILWILLISLAGSSHAVIGLQSYVLIEPEKSQIVLQNTLQFPADLSQHAIRIKLATPILSNKAQIIQADTKADANGNYDFLLHTDEDARLQLSYVIDLPKLDSKFQQMPDAVINADFLYLDPQLAWYPRPETALQIDYLHISAPPEWVVNTSVKPHKSQGGSHIYLPGQFPDNLYLLAGRYHHYQLNDEIPLVEILLLNDDPALAERYLQHSRQYLELYSGLIGAYPYDKFTVIENHWQTGFAYPSMTLLGSRVIRLPFLLYTSLPHEILHNWWGNGVFVDYRSGNWSEGLTAYMADHLISEQRGEDADYRLKALARYTQFAREDQDFSISEFRYRHNESSQAVGYSKVLMLFHSLRKQLGDEHFYNQLRLFWQQSQFKYVDFKTLLEHLISPLGINSAALIEQSLFEPGAPTLSLKDVDNIAVDDGYQISFTLQQSQPLRTLAVPVTLSGTDGLETIHWLTLQKHSEKFIIRSHQPVKQLEIDKNFDVLRKLSEKEIPPTLGKLFSAKDQWLVYPSKASIEEQQAWLQLARDWQTKFGRIQVISDSNAGKLKPTAAIWIAGRQNLLLETTTPDDAQTHHKIAVTESGDGQLRGLLAISGAANIQQLARRLPHYKTYGTLIFDRESGKNLLKSKASNITNHPLKFIFAQQP